MSGSNRRDRGALVALGLILLAIVLVAGITAFSHPSHPKEPAASQGDIEQNAKNNITPDVAGSDNFNPWADPIDQWFMACFAAIGTGVSILALVWVRGAFLETARAANAAVEGNKTAREIGEAQVRAYLSITGGNYEIWGDDLLLIKVTIVNSGQSPSQSGYVDWNVRFIEWMPDIGNLAHEPRESSVKRTGFATITAGSDKGVCEERFFTADGLTERFFEKNSSFRIQCTINWIDVFKKPSAESFTLRSVRGEIAEENRIYRELPDAIGELVVVPR